MNTHLISVPTSLSVSLRRCGVALLLLVSLALSSSLARAATDEKKAGAQLLRAQLPNGTTIQQADCAVLSRAVSHATLDHKADASAILSAALTNGSTDDTLRKEEKRSCECVTHIVRASVKAAPLQASAVLDVATALYPECADSFASILDQARKDLAAYDYKDSKDYKGAGSQPVAGIISRGGDPGAATSTGGFGAGFGPGFPGSPNFGGSNPSGGVALPAPSGAPAVTPVVNQ